MPAASPPCPEASQKHVNDPDNSVFFMSLSDISSVKLFFFTHICLLQLSEKLCKAFNSHAVIEMQHRTVLYWNIVIEFLPLHVIEVITMKATVMA